jgi:NCAIR mutase (PurE)-related protein
MSSGDGLGRAGGIPPTLNLDHDRLARCGFPEVVYGAGKTTAEVVGAATRLVATHGQVLVTRCEPEALAALKSALPDGTAHARSRCFTAGEPEPKHGPVALISAGTSDEPVAEEAEVTLLARATRVERFRDCGVAGLHRLLAKLDAIRACDCAIVCAGMDGALPSVVGGLLDIPVIACPTSVGYGVAAGGQAALGSMLSSCAPGVLVVNIDNGFGAGYAAANIARAISRGARAPGGKRAGA